MDLISSALIEAIVHIETRDVTNDIADDDVRALEEIFHDLRKCDSAQKLRFLETVNLRIAESTDPRRTQTLEAIIENLEP